MFGKDSKVEEVIYAMRDEGSNTTLVRESLVNKLKSKGEAVDFKLTTMNMVSEEKGKSHLLYVQGLDQKDCLEIPNALSVKDISVDSSCIPTSKQLRQWRHLNGVEIPELENPEVIILIGTDVPEAHWKLEERRGRKKESYAVRTSLGWSVAVPMGSAQGNDVSALFIRQEDEYLRETVNQMFSLDFSESSYSQASTMSLEDHKALTIMTESVTDIDGHYQLDLPLKDEKPVLADNRAQAEKRLNSLKWRLKKDPDLYEKYCKGIHDYVDKGFAEKLDGNEDLDDGGEFPCTWYLPHHPVFHPQKPDKCRIVFDCAAKYKGMSLNDKLLQGPDMTNKLVAVLLRFRQEPIAFMADIEAMFCQVRVTPKHRNLLKFLWWKDDNYENPPEEYRMAVHLFGAKSSPSCASFCLKRTAEESQKSSIRLP